MGLFGKRKRDDDFGPSVPYLPTSSEDIPPLPPLRQPSLREQLGDDKLPPLPPLPPLQQDMDMDESDLPPALMPRSLPPLPPMRKPMAPPLPRLPDERRMPAPLGMQGKPTHVFVRLDKYTAILKAINGMESKISELRSTITKINGIKDKEHEILEGWVTLLQDAKTRVDDVSRRLPDVEQA